MTDKLTPAEMAEDARANYDEALRAMRHRTFAGKDGGYITVTERVINESERIVTRPATTEEAAKLKIARGINEAAEKMANKGLSERKEIG